jgi:hypothetical protein
VEKKKRGFCVDSVPSYQQCGTKGVTVGNDRLKNDGVLN